MQVQQDIRIRSAALSRVVSCVSFSVETGLGPKNSRAYWGCYKTMMSMFLKYLGVLLRRTFGHKGERSVKIRKITH